MIKKKESQGTCISVVGKGQVVSLYTGRCTETLVRTESVKRQEDTTCTKANDVTSANKVDSGQRPGHVLGLFFVITCRICACLLPE